MLRKAVNIFGDAERRFIASGRLPAGEAEYLGNVIELLSENGGFSGAAAEALSTAYVYFVSAAGKNETTEIRRTLNTVCHILLTQTGRNQADWDFIAPSGELDPAKRCPFPGMQVYLEDIRSPFNVGSMFRTAESFGAEKIWLSPLCADPRHQRAERTAMGCVNVLPWERFPHDPFAGLDTGSGSSSAFSGFPIFALETGGTFLENFTFPARGILVAGCEELGVSPSALEAADASLGRVTIPTCGAKGSLNVSVAFGIVMQAWTEALSHRYLSPTDGSKILHLKPNNASGGGTHWRTGSIMGISAGTDQRIRLKFEYKRGSPVK
jgi:TrmH family RNA methyltransferase